MTILSILDELAATSSTNEKVKILEREKDNELLKQVFRAAYNPFNNYYIKQIPEYRIGSPTPCDWSLQSAMIELDKFVSRELTGNNAINHLKFVLQKMNNRDNCVVFERIIQRDLRCGTSDTLASRVWPGLVPTFDVMLCDNDLARIKYPAIIQTKCDGARVHLMFNGYEVKAMSRAGKEFQIHGALDNTAKHYMKEGETFDGELLVVKDGKVLDRKTSNGILNKASKGTISKEEADMIVAVVWDIVDFTSTIPYSERFKTLKERFNIPTSKMSLVPSEVVQNSDAAMEFFKGQLEQGQEGAVLKNMDSKWIPKRSKELCKLKEINSADLIVVDTFEGTGKYAGMIGGLICETSDGLLNVRVGSGFSDEERNSKPEQWIGKIVEVLYNQKITSKGKDKASLFLPRLSCVRFDKSVANTIGELK